MGPTAKTRDVARAAAPGFADILCAVDGSRGSAAGVRQAIALAGPGGHITFVCVTDVRGVGANRVAGVGEHRAAMALAGAKALARDGGVVCTTELIHAPGPVDEILARQGEHELLVIGSHRESRAGGILTGSTATFLAHRTAGPLLVAREVASPEPFPRRIVVATDAASPADPVVATAQRLAVAYGAHVHVVHAASGGRGALGELTADLTLKTGREPLVTSERADPAELIVQIAQADGAGLLIVGHGGRHGIAALGSVSERVVHAAPCSVLLVPA